MRPHVIEAPERLRSASTLDDPSYTYACEIARDRADERSAEEWARAVIEDAPSALRWFIVAGWIGGLWLRLAPRRAPDQILGWKIITNTPAVVASGVESYLLTARLVVEVGEASVTHATFVRFEHRLGRIAWAIAQPIHRRVIPYLLARGATRPTPSHVG